MRSHCRLIITIALDGFIFVISPKVYRIRSKFLQAVLRQDVGWYDTKSSNDFASRITEYGLFPFRLGYLYIGSNNFNNFLFTFSKSET